MNAITGDDLARWGIHASVTEDGDLHLAGPRAALAEERLLAIRANKASIIDDISAGVNIVNVVNVESPSLSGPENERPDGVDIHTAIAVACDGLTIAPTDVYNALATEDIESWLNRDIGTDVLTAFARSLAQRREIHQGIVPPGHTKSAVCRHCGPIWLWFSGEVLGCPWCWNRVAERPIPRPQAISCGDCVHFKRIAHPHLGHCTKDQPEAYAGLWDTDFRACLRWQPPVNDQMNEGIDHA